MLFNSLFRLNFLLVVKILICMYTYERSIDLSDVYKETDVKNGSSKKSIFILLQKKSVYYFF